MTTYTHPYLGLTPDEWLTLLDMDGPELPRCCANISGVRESLYFLLIERTSVTTGVGKHFLEAYEAAQDTHDLGSHEVLARLAHNVRTLREITPREETP